jgi:hypothetical protein
MLKKISAKQDQKLDAAIRAQFATDVIDLYRARMAGQMTTHPDPDVRAVAFGLVALKQALTQATERALQRHPNDPQVLVYTGVAAADEIITALTTTGRRKHPLLKHIDGLKTSVHLATPGTDQKRREMFAGVVLAYQDTAKIKQWDASRAVAAGIIAKDFPVNAGQLRQWVRRNGRAARTYADRFLVEAAKVPAELYSETDRILIVGREALFTLLVVPS